MPSCAALASLTSNNPDSIFQLLARAPMALWPINTETALPKTCWLPKRGGLTTQEAKQSTTTDSLEATEPERVMLHTDSVMMESSVSSMRRLPLGPAESDVPSTPSVSAFIPSGAMRLEPTWAFGATAL